MHRPTCRCRSTLITTHQPGHTDAMSLS